VPDRMEGEPLSVEDKEVEFSLWPTKSIPPRYELNHRIYVTDPWPFLQDYVSRSIKNDEQRKKDAFHFLRQAEGYYLAATSTSIREAKPVLIYYSFENLVKSAILCGDFGRSLDTGVEHGLILWGSKRVGDKWAKDGLKATAYSDKISVFRELLDFIGTARLVPGTEKEYWLSNLLPQILMGHRIWAAGGNKPDRFVRVKEILLMQGNSKKKIWLRLELERANLQSCKLSCEELLSRTGLKNEWHEVLSGDDKLITLEQCEAEPYDRSPIEKLKVLADSIRLHLWQAAVISHPYRKYYLYAAPNEEHDEPLPQVASIYALMFYLSLLTRYHPSEYRKLLGSSHGPFCVGFLQDSPKQFLYLFASEMMKQEVSSGDHV